SASPERSPSTVSGRRSSNASMATPAPSSGCRSPPFERCCATASASAGTNSGTADCPLQNEGDPSRNDTNGGSTTTFQPEVLRFVRPGLMQAADAGTAEIVDTRRNASVKFVGFGQIAG